MTRKVRAAGPFVLLLLASCASQAGDWSWHVGAHDFMVPEVDSDTFGVNVGAAWDHRTGSGRHLFALADIYGDFDQDHLDPDHIPVWWEVRAGTDGTFWQSGAAHLDWSVDFDTRMNTTSSIERRMTLLPSVVAGFDTEVFSGALKAGPGWFFLEIDDDVPKTRGYTRDDFRNSTFAGSVAAKGTIRFGKAVSMTVGAQNWWDGSESLQFEARGELRFDASSWTRGGDVVISATYNDYNLAPYQIDGLEPILPWHDDLLARVLLENRW